MTRSCIVVEIEMVLGLGIVALLTVGISQERVVVNDFKGVGYPNGTLKAASQSFAEEMGRYSNLTVKSRGELQGLLESMQWRQMMGCTEADCMIDISTLAGAEYVILGELTQVEKAHSLAVSRVNTMTGDVVGRGRITDQSIAGIQRQIPFLVRQLLSSAERQSQGQLGFIEVQDYDDALWIASNHVSEQVGQRKASGVSGQEYRVRLPGTHFRFGNHDNLENKLFFESTFDFPGQFPSCFGRSRAELSAFVLPASEKLFVSADRVGARRYREGRVTGTLELELLFKVRGGEVHAAEPYDWRDCEDSSTKPFTPKDKAPTLSVEILGARLLSSKGAVISGLQVEQTTFAGSSVVRDVSSHSGFN